jgi:cyclic beta-1,2-glucan synthetase
VLSGARSRRHVGINPVREELFSVGRLEEHARKPRSWAPVEPKPAKGHPLAGRLADNGAVLLDAYRSIVKPIDKGRAITLVAEWRIDNYHPFEKQMHGIRSDLPPGYYRQLPKLAAGPFAG